MKNNKEYLAEGYRTPKLVMKDFVLNMVTLGIKRPDNMREDARTYQYYVDNEKIKVVAEEESGESKEIARKVFHSEEEKESILSKGKFKEGAYVYYLDKETIREK